MFESFRQEIEAVLRRDPAARNSLEVWLSYPGFHALVHHRLAHRLWKSGWRMTARLISALSRHITGVEIHPAAKVGRGVFIDHGMGVVVGETAEIGDNVTLYQGVTLGGLAPSVDSHLQVDVKRHPTLGEGVIVGAGAQILGPFTIGAGARIGGNAVVVEQVPPGVTVVGIPARVVSRSRPGEAEKSDFDAYGLPGGKVSDPVSRICDELLVKIETLTVRVTELEKELAAQGQRPAGDESARSAGRS
jgi:serine O-acetyltransferase